MFKFIESILEAGKNLNRSWSCPCLMRDELVEPEVSFRVIAAVIEAVIENVELNQLLLLRLLIL
jgi:hypothetical protein